MQHWAPTEQRQGVRRERKKEGKHIIALEPHGWFLPRQPYWSPRQPSNMPPRISRSGSFTWLQLSFKNDDQVNPKSLHRCPQISPILFRDKNLGIPVVRLSICLQGANNLPSWITNINRKLESGNGRSGEESARNGTGRAPAIVSLP